MSDDPTGPRSSLPRMGPRGEGWVVLQIALAAAALAAGFWGPAWPAAGAAWRLAGASIACALGAALLAAAGATLGRQLTPLPRPVEGGALRDRGVYALARHPMYGGALLLLLGWALFRSPLALLATAAGAVFLDAKRRMEEAWLMQHHAGYAEYRRRVRWRLIPFLW